jgi:hypothetical protein
LNRAIDGTKPRCQWSGWVTTLEAVSRIDAYALGTIFA